MISIPDRVKFANTHMSNRLGKTIIYSRYCTESYNPETGATIIYFEKPSYTAIPLSASGSEVDNSSGRVQIGDIAFTFIFLLSNASKIFAFVLFSNIFEPVILIMATSSDLNLKKSTK